MNIQTVDDLIADLAALPPHVRRQPVHLKIDIAADNSVYVQQTGAHVTLVQSDFWEGRTPVQELVTCPECEHEFIPEES
jgi:hypothetical protein